MHAILIIIMASAMVALAQSSTDLATSEIASSENNVKILGSDSTSFPKIKINMFIDKLCAFTSDLKQDNFKVEEDGNSVELSDFYFSGNASSHKLDFALVFDDTGSMGEEISATKSKVHGLTDQLKSSGLDARYALVTFKDSYSIKTNWTNNPDKFKSSVNSLQQNGGDDEPEVSLDAIGAVLEMGFRPDAQKVIVVITDAHAHYKDDGSTFSKYTKEDIKMALKETGVIFIPISPTFDKSSSFVDLREISNDIQSTWIDINSEEFSTILEQIQGILTGTYVIEYTSPDRTPGKNRTILVAVNAPGCVVGSDSGAYTSPGSVTSPNSPPTIDDLTSDKTSPQDASTTINWTANAIDPDGDLVLYKFFLDGKPMTQWAEDKTWMWVAGQAGSYRVEVQVRDAKHADSDGQDDRRGESFTINEPKPAATDNQTPIINDLLAVQGNATEITWTASATDPENDPILHRFILNNKTATNWIKENKWILNTSEADVGNNSIEVQIRDGKHKGSDGYDDAKIVHFKLSSMKLMVQTWEKKLDEISANSVKQTEDGGYIVAGSHDGSVINDIPPEFMLIKTDSYGNTLWERSFGGGEGYHAEQTRDGGYIAVGHKRYSDPKDMMDILLIKTDENGNRIWDKTFGGSRSQWGRFVQQTKDGNYLISGEYESISGPMNSWVIRTDSEGNVEWDKTFGETTAVSALQTDDGGYVIIGYTVAGDPLTSWIIKADSNGNEQWHKSLRMGFAKSGQRTKDGGYIIGGIGNIMNLGLLTKTDENGNKEWSTYISETDFVDFAQQTSDGGYIVASGDGLIKTDENGNEIWKRTFSGTNNVNFVQQTSDGGYIAAADYWLIKTNENGNM